jgi:hypothetical protein
VTSRPHPIAPINAKSATRVEIGRNSYSTIVI